jgi:hypothetical protein
MRTRATTEGRSRTIERVSRLSQRQRARGRRRTKRAMKTMDLRGKRVSLVDWAERDRTHAAKSGFLVGRPPVKEKPEGKLEAMESIEEDISMEKGGGEVGGKEVWKERESTGAFPFHS